MLSLLAAPAQSLLAHLASHSRAATTEVLAIGDLSRRGSANAVDEMASLGAHCQQLVGSANEVIHPCGGWTAPISLTPRDERAKAMPAPDIVTVPDGINIQGPAADRTLLRKIS